MIHPREYLRIVSSLECNSEASFVRRAINCFRLWPCFLRGNLSRCLSFSWQSSGLLSLSTPSRHSWCLSAAAWGGRRAGGQALASEYWTVLVQSLSLLAIWLVRVRWGVRKREVTKRTQWVRSVLCNVRIRVCASMYLVRSAHTYGHNCISNLYTSTVCVGARRSRPTRGTTLRCATARTRTRTQRSSDRECESLRLRVFECESVSVDASRSHCWSRSRSRRSCSVQSRRSSRVNRVGSPAQPLGASSSQLHIETTRYSWGWGWGWGAALSRVRVRAQLSRRVFSSLLAALSLRRDSRVARCAAFPSCARLAPHFAWSNWLKSEPPSLSVGNSRRRFSRASPSRANNFFLGAGFAWWVFCLRELSAQFSRICMSYWLIR